MTRPWQTAERFWARLLPGRTQPGSGNRPGAPGDARVARIHFAFEDECLLESKSTTNKSLSVKEDWLKKISLEALQLGLTPLVGLDINGERWLMLPAWAIGLDNGQPHTESDTHDAGGPDESQQ